MPRPGSEGTGSPAHRRSLQPQPARGTLAVTLLLFVALAGCPSADATESVTKSYIGGSASLLDKGVGFSTAESDMDDDGEPDLPAIGGNHLYATSPYANAVIATSDDLFGSDGGYNACFTPPDSGLTTKAHCTGNVCGTSLLGPSTYMSDEILIWTYSIVVQPDLSVCGATSGTLTGMFF